MDLMTRREAMTRTQKLTKKEKMIAWGLAWGFSYDDISERMNTERATVKLHVHHIRRKMGCQTYAVPLILIMSEGLRKPDLQNWPGVPTNPCEE